AWGAWDGGGMTSPAAVAELARRGVLAMSPPRAIRALEQALDAGEAQLVVTSMDWTRFAPAFGVRRASPLLRDLPEAAAALQAAPAVPSGADRALRGRLAGLPRAEQDRVLTDLVRAEAAAVLGHAGPESIDAARAFRELGLDSLTALDLRNRLAAATGLTLAATLVYDHPSPADLARHLWALEFTGGDAGDPLAAELDRFESRVSALTDGDEARELVEDRLKRLLAKVAGTAGAGDGQVVARKIESASDDDLINFIHAELGR
ncbi:MAG TPA: phosphopantetheine-binding protein, partial [Trebonia sp.]